MTAKSKVQKMQQEIEEAEYSLVLKQYEAEQNLIMNVPFQESYDPFDYSDPIAYDSNGVLDLPSRADDYKDGDNAPFWQTEVELSQIRGISRNIAQLNEIGLGAIDIFAKYVVGTGFEFGVESNNHPEKAEAVEAFVGEWDERVGFTGSLDEELKKRELSDGEYFVWVAPIGNGRATLRIFEPDEVTEPNEPYRLEEFYNIPPCSWKYGIATDPIDTSVIYGYFVSWNGSHSETQFVPAEQVVHVKRNVVRRVKRGVSDFYPVQGELRRAEKLLRNMVHGGSTQASIALIRNHNDGVSKEQITDIRSGLASRTVTNGGKITYLNDDRGGQIIDSSKCETTLGPIGSTQGANFELIYQAALRTIGTRWHMPEYLVSGDASNNSFASTLVAESPFVKTAEVEQSRTGKAFNRIRRIVAKMGAAGGLIPGVSVKDIDLMKFTATGGKLVIRERDKDFTVDSGLVEKGVMSLETLAARNDLNLDEEIAKGATAGAEGSEPTEPVALPTET